MLYIFLLSVFYFHDCMADPWGKDADLCVCPILVKQAEKYCPTPILGAFADMMIGFHQNVISPADGPRSHFLPSSSQYTLDAMHKYGFFRGFTMGCDRLLRENSEAWIYPTILHGHNELMKWDPVP